MRDKLRTVVPVPRDQARTDVLLLAVRSVLAAATMRGAGAPVSLDAEYVPGASVDGHPVFPEDDLGVWNVTVTVAR